METAWTFEPVTTAAGVDLVLTVPGLSATVIRLALDRDEARRCARGILAAAGDATERTFPHPRITEAQDG